MQKQKQIIAHRGAPNLARENTLEAFKKAIELGVEAVELDVRKTKDGILAVFHDDEIMGEKLSDITFDQLNSIAKSQNFNVPTLEQALEFLAGKAFVHIEMKAKGYEKKTAETALKFLNSGNFAIISFYFKSLKKIKKNYSEIKTGLILGEHWKTWLETLKFLLHRKVFLKNLDFLAISFKLWERGFRIFIPKSFPVGVWTVDKAELIRKFLRDSKVSMLTSNIPDLALEVKEQV